MGKIIVRLLRRGMLKERAGNTAMIFALLTPVLVLLGGGAIDLTQVSMRQASLQQAADAAAVGAVARSSPGYKYAVNTMAAYGSIPDSVTASTTSAVFNANWKQPNDTTTPAIAGTSCGGSTLVCKQLTPTSVVSVSSIITVSAAYTPSFLGLVGQKSIKLKAVAQASDNIPVYMNFNMLLDNTPSMGIAATPSDITTMVNNTPDQCAFACHDISNPAGNYYVLANKLGVHTRIYNVAQAASNLLATAQNTETTNGIPNEFSVALYDFGVAASDPTASSYAGFNQVYPTAPGTTTTNLSAAASAATTIDLMTVNGQGQYNDQDTNLNAPLSYAAQNLVSTGTGVSASSPQQVLFIVSDGVNDTYNCAVNNVGACRAITSLDTTACTTLKGHGIKVAVLYTEYYPLPTNSFWQTYVAKNLQSWLSPWTGSPPNDTIANNMQACASTGLYFKVSASGDINAAMNALFQAVVASVKITS